MKIELQSRNFEAFLMTAQTLHFAHAAERLFITPSALSQRISALESQLQSKLFHRNANTVSMTDTGDRLLRYCQSVKALEDEMLRDVGGNKNLGGTLTIAAFSSISRSVLMPALRDLQCEHPELNIHFEVVEIFELHEILARGQVDLIVSQDVIEKAGYQSVLLGHENNVLLESASASSIKDVYLDHKQSDDFTERFLFHFDGCIKTPLHRRFYNDIYGILDGVMLGLGRAVVPLHLLDTDMAVRLADGYPGTWSTPVYLQYPNREYYSAPIRTAIDTLVARCGDLLNQNACGW